MSVPFAIRLEESLAEGFGRQLMTLARRSAVPEEGVVLLGRVGRAVSRATAMGHVCLRLSELLATDDLVALAEVRAALFDSGLVADEQSRTSLPLVLDREGRLYLGRYFEYERRLAAMLMARATAVTAGVETVGAAADDGVGLAFASQRQRPADRVDWQRLAAAMAIRNRLTIIAGGPGTGKTTTVVTLLTALLAANPKLRIVLAAPTGKAAQRMQDAIRERARHLPDTVRSLLPTESFTIHRLLGVIPESQNFRHHAANPLPLDVLVVDEASMLDLALATKLVAAVPEEARLIFLGDKDQLAAVEAGAVFSEISSDPSMSEPCRQQLANLTGLAAEVIQPPAAGEPSPLHDAVIWLSDNYRFGTESGIGQLAQAVNGQDVAAALACLRRGADDVRWVEDGGPQLAPQVLAELVAGFDDYLHCLGAAHVPPAAAFEALGRFRVLCAVCDSERGLDWLNDSIAQCFRDRLAHPQDDGRTPWYPGRPLMILRNDYVLKLFNGDIGIILPTVDGDLMAHFPTSDGGFRALALARLPPHETAFAITVHKAQGSEFEEVALVLPAYSSQVLTRELVYTAITRAKRKVRLYCSAEVLCEAIQKQSSRHSGLISRMRAG